VEKMDANVLIDQLGGLGPLVASVAAYDFVKDGESLTFKFKGSRKMNMVKITLTVLDLYDVTFYRFSPKHSTVKEVETHSGVYCDVIKRLFESVTGLHTTL